MNWQELREKQARLDNYIVYMSQIKNPDEMIKKRMIALVVEVAELANEMKQVFKYWSKKENNYAEALEESADVLHFILSVENHYSFSYRGVGTIKENSIQDQFVSLIHEITELAKEDADEHSKLILIRGLYIGLIEMIGFTMQELEDAYNRKYEKNIERQQNSY